jgi:hypothetical protein
LQIAQAQRNRSDGEKPCPAKLAAGHYSAHLASFSKPPGITRKASVFGSRIAIHYYNNRNYMYLFKYFLREHLPSANICQAAGHLEPLPTRLKDGFALPFQMI